MADGPGATQFGTRLSAMCSLPTTFESTGDLARLPWFDIVDGRLVLDPDVGPTVDMHAHLALSYLRRPSIDLNRASERPLTYLPFDAPMDLDIYANRNLDGAAMAAMKTDLTRDSLGPSGLRASHTIPNLRRAMADLGVSTTVLHAIDMPAGLSRNAATWLTATADIDELVVFGSVHPLTRRPEAALDAQRANGARGIKLHPAVQLVHPSGPRSLRLYRACGVRNLPVFFHCGPVDIETRVGRRLSQVVKYERAVAECPDTTFILGHSGALQFDVALRLAREYPNVWLELASQPLSVVRRAIAEGPTSRVMFGSDWPFYPQAMGLAKVLLATENDAAARTRVLRGNATTLLRGGTLALGE